LAIPIEYFFDHMINFRIGQFRVHGQKHRRRRCAQVGSDRRCACLPTDNLLLVDGVG
jgi:hypothetical protein